MNNIKKAFELYIEDVAKAAKLAPVAVRQNEPARDSRRDTFEAMFRRAVRSFGITLAEGVVPSYRLAKSPSQPAVGRVSVGEIGAIIPPSPEVVDLELKEEPTILGNGRLTFVLTIPEDLDPMAAEWQVELISMKDEKKFEVKILVYPGAEQEVSFALPQDLADQWRSMLKPNPKPHELPFQLLLNAKG